MHTHHKILWTMALLACGSSLTPVKGTQNNLTESVQAVSSKVGAIAADSDIAKTIGAQASILLSDADLIKAVTAVQGAVGNVTGGEADDVYKQLTNPISGAIKKINLDTTTLAEAITSLINAVGPIDTYGDIVKTIQNKNNLLAMPDSTP